MNINLIYKKEKIINAEFRKKYNYSDPVIFYEQVLELIVELSELAYETKCFKYWKKDQASAKEIIFREYENCLMIALSFCDLIEIKTIELTKVEKKDIIQMFIHLNNLASQIKINLNDKLLIEIISNLVELSNLLNFLNEDIEKYCFQKMDETLNMISKKE